MRSVAICVGILLIAARLTGCAGGAITPMVQPGATVESQPTAIGLRATAESTPLVTRAASPTVGAMRQNTPGTAGTPTTVVRASMPSATPMAMPQTIAAAEAEGRAFPTAPPPQASAPIFGQASGTAERRCVAVVNQSSGANLPASSSGAVGLRSGEFVAGPLLSYAEMWARDPASGKIWWVPLHTATMPGLTVRAVLLDDPSIAHLFTFPLPASNANGPFYPSGVRLPQPGQWMLIATAGPDWGCFTLTLPGPTSASSASPMLIPEGTGVPLAPPPTVEAATWERLRRPLQLPALAVGNPCPAARGHSVAPAYGPAVGDGPVYAVGLGETGVLRLGSQQDGGWFQQKVLFLIGPDHPGPVLIRGRQLDGSNEVRYGVGAAPSAEHQLSPAIAGTPDWRGFPTSVRLQTPGCYAWQFDGEGFSDVIIFQVVR